MLAAWIVVFFVAAVGLLLLYSHGDAARDRLILSRWHAHPVAGPAEWSDAKCHPAVQSCLNFPAQDNSTDAVRALVERYSPVERLEYVPPCMAGIVTA